MGIINRTGKSGYNKNARAREISAGVAPKEPGPPAAQLNRGRRSGTGGIYTKKIQLEDIDIFNKFSSPSSHFIDILEAEFAVGISIRGNELIIRGEKYGVEICADFINNVINLYKSNKIITEADFIRLAKHKSENPEAGVGSHLYADILVTPRKKPIAPRTVNQKKYVDAIYKNDIVIGVGPAGTGKTYLAMACAISLFNKKLSDRIILPRPAVEAGEKLGFLPGDISQKINPYLRPLYDALYEMIEFEKAMKLIETDIIEVAPLAFMRGRTLNNSFIILDEAQNATNEQMKMMLTRIGSGSKIIVNGDITQTDLPSDKESGLITARKILSGIAGIEIVSFNETDVLRHKLVQNIIKAYEANKIPRISKK